MGRVIDMQLMRYINLFSRISKVTTKNCFVYNGQIYFAVPKSKVSMAIGKNAANVKRLSEILGRKIVIVEMPYEESVNSIEKFVRSIVSPIEFSKLEVRDRMATINAGRQSKAALIGRGRIREKELGEILKDNFGILKVRIA